MRSAFVCIVPALVVAANWLRLEQPEQGGRALVLVALALVPALAPRLWQRLSLLAVSLVAAADVATRASVLHPRHLAELAVAQVWNGVLAFYYVRLPFDPAFRPEMHVALVAAAFGFVALLGLVAASRRPLIAVLVLIVGAGWPATLLENGHELVRGAVILAAALVLLAGLRPGARGTPVRAAIAGAALVAVALAAATQPAIAKNELFNWQSWDLYTKPPHPVGVRYVWDARYDGFTWPKQITIVFKVKASATSVYWRATTLDRFGDGRWQEQLVSAQPEFLNGKLDVAQGDALAVAAARDPSNWRESQFDIRAFADDHLVAPSGATAFGSGFGSARFTRGGLAIVDGGLKRGDVYSTWSYAPQPTPKQLAASPARYPKSIARELAVPRAGYAALVAQARRVVGGASGPYAAALGLESWFRSTGGFTYTQHPPAAAHTLVGFLRVKAGYCQHFAGAMALMLRYLGVPARVAEGFVSGTYDSSTRTWTVTDHDAHAWVEVWFAGFGWLPFDPTPGRGSLSAPYSVSSPSFRVGSVASIVGGVAASLLNTAAIHQDVGFGEKGNGLIAGAPALLRPKGSSGIAAGAGRGASLARLLALALAGTLGLLAAVKFVRRKVRYATADPRQLAAACRAELADFLADQRVPLGASAAPHELAVMLRRQLEVDARPFAAAFAAARFGPPAQAPSAVLRAKRELAALRSQIRSRVGPLRRARGFISLRSLGVSGLTLPVDLKLR
ncbi:MAG: transglutaminase-like domain-containing protein [Gaiellaceae bacterium]